MLMEALLRRGIIDFLSIFLSSLILLYFAEWLLLPYIFHPIMIGFITVSTLIAVLISRLIKSLENFWGNAVSVFMAVIITAFFFSWFSVDTVLFVIWAIPASMISIVIWKIWDSRSAAGTPAHRPVAKRLPATIYKRKK